MKKKLKSIIAAALCLLLTLSLLPTQVFAEDDLGEVVPGVVGLKLLEPYYGDIAELFPELDIESGYDFYLSVITSAPNYDPEVGPTGVLVPYIGKTFSISLNEKTVEAVFRAIALLEASPLIEYVTCDRYVYGDSEAEYAPGKLIVQLNEKYEGDISNLFPGIEIESWYDIFGGFDSEALKELEGKSFSITLSDKSEEALAEAIAVIEASELVKNVSRDIIVSGDDADFDTKICNAYADYAAKKYGHLVTEPKITRKYGEVGDLFLANMQADDLLVLDDFYGCFFNGYWVYEYQMDDSMILFDGEKAYSIQEAIDLGLLADTQIAQVADLLNAHRYSEKLDVSYALMALRASVGLSGKVTPLMFEKFDLDGDGEISVADALVVLRKAAGIVYGD